MGRIDENREWKDVYCNTKYGFICEGAIPEAGNEFLSSIQKDDPTLIKLTLFVQKRV